jgi:FkbM family methyltransferase
MPLLLKTIFLTEGNTQMHIVRNEIDRDSEAVNTIKKLALPVILYGNARMAELEERTLRGYNISVTCRTVDEIPVGAVGNMIAASQIDDRFSAYVLVLANGRAISRMTEKGGEESLKARFSNAVYICYLNGIYGFDLISAKFYSDNEACINQLCESFEDEKSKKSIEAYLNSQISRDRRFLLPYIETPQYFTLGPMKLRHDEMFVDCGAYDGDTIRDFLRVVDRRYRRIFAFEPDVVSFASLRKYILDEYLENIEVVALGAYDCKTELRFSISGDNSAFSENGDVIIETDTIDAVTDCEATVIKMDIEGAEMKALHGAENTIRKCRLNLMICVYHKPTDIIDIPSYISSLVPEYRFYFRVHKAALVDAVLYATVR